MKALRLVLALAVIVTFVACTSGQEKDLTGSWQREDGTGTIEFTRDGKLNVAGGPAAISAGYKLKDKENLQVDLGLFGTGNLKYALQKDSLTITDAAGKTAKYTRVKDLKMTKGQEAKPAATAGKEQPRAEVKKEQKPQVEANKAKEQKPQAEAPKHQ
ncbi:MAG: hypothetical protein AAGU11_18145 [Syntrophobacteraceae bacterium]